MLLPQLWQPAPRKSPPPSFENDKVAPAAEGSRVIAVSFAPQTKTTLEEGLQPEFADGDSILLVSYSKGPNEAPITEIRRVKEATISTNLTGDLTALYPAKYAKQMTSGKFGLNVPAVQSGKFADANFCVTLTPIKEGDKSATFTTIKSLFIITPPEGAKSLTVKSLKQIETTGGQRTGDIVPVNSSEKEEDVYSISIPNGPGSDKKYYVALNEGVNLSDLSFEAWFDKDGSTGSIKGIPTSRIAQQAGTDVIVGSEAYNTYNTVAEGTAYTIDDKNWHDYVTVAGRKWATMNIGAESETEAGEYFMWGDVAGHKYVSDAWTNFPETNPDGSRYTGTWTPTSGFAGCNAPFVSTYDYNELYWTCSYNKYNETDGKDRLDLCDDAAFANWGGAWRMPTGKESGEFQALYGATYWARESDGKGYYLFLPEDAAGHSAGSCGEIGSLDTKKALLFFPASGIGSGMGLSSVGTNDFYFSSSFDKEYSYGLRMTIFNSFIIINTMSAQSYRCNGHPIRAIIDDAASATGSTVDDFDVKDDDSSNWQ